MIKSTKQLFIKCIIVPPKKQLINKFLKLFLKIKPITKTKIEQIKVIFHETLKDMSIFQNGGVGMSFEL